MTSITPAGQAERQVEEIRGELARTLDALRTNLQPRRLANEALAATRARTPDWLAAYWSVARSPIGLGVIGAAAASLTGAIVARKRIVRRRRRRL